MSATSEELARLVRETHAMVAEMSKRLASTGSAGAAAPSVGAAPDHELDRDFANFVVDKDPKQWKGESFAGSRLSETNAAYCRAVASLKSWKGDKEKAEGKTYQNKKGETQQSCEYSYKQAAWALGWAARFDAGHTAPNRSGDALDGFPGGEADIPY